MPRSCRRTVRNCARIFAQARARKKSRKIARKSAKTSERSMKTDGSYATTARNCVTTVRNCVTIDKKPTKIGGKGTSIVVEAAAGVGRHSPLRKRGSGRCPAPPCPLLVALVEHLERVAIARHLPVLPGVLQPLLQLVHLLLPLAVGRALVEQVEQRHVDDLAAPDDHVLVDPAGKGFAGVLLHNLGLERVIAYLRLRDRANDLDLLPQLRNVPQEVALDLFVTALVELLHRLADEDLDVDRRFPDSVRGMAAEAEPVILLLRLRISQDPVGLADLLEAGLRLLVAGMEIRMVLLRQLAVDALDLLRCGILLNTQYFVVVLHTATDYSIGEGVMSGWHRAGRPDEPGNLQVSLRGCNAEATRCNRAGDTAWVPRCSAGRTAGSAGPRRRNAQLRWAMRWQDPRAVGDKNPSPCPLPQGAREVACPIGAVL